MDGKRKESVNKKRNEKKLKNNLSTGYRVGRVARKKNFDNPEVVWYKVK